MPDPDSCLDRVAETTDVEPVDALFDPVDERLLVLVPSGTADDVTQSVGALQSALGWPVEVVTYAGDAAGLIENALAPATVHNVTVSQSGVAYAEVDREDRGLAIGNGGTRIRRARLLAERYYGVDDVELT
ncbi:NusA-like transcription termination signal-binding factor [Halorarius litoreus]|uniref:NusA-like transcription termination signal-binding factor n=1 Tax=Halorarius litoreus TaxID=2962676 RepID=UPI0020CE2682|nr:NusA-like transcription termination signal-binding factor [Halorarius litoreus]